MKMKEAINGFLDQLRFDPVIENKKRLKKAKDSLVCGMGGSHLAADLAGIPAHSDYGLPKQDLKKKLIILSSYSGNTEEALDSFKEALSKKLSSACISIGGKLLESAEKHSIPYIKMPDTGINPRSALGFSAISLLKILGREKDIEEIKNAADSISMQEAESEGKELAKKLKNRIPVIYSSLKNASLAYNWKIKFNENSKIPAFSNSFPELNHNELVGLENRDLSDRFYFIFLEDREDHPRNLLRMKITKEILEKKNLPVEVLKLKEVPFWEKIFSSILIADWASFYLAEYYNQDVGETRIISELKDSLGKL
ncbi:MAG: bifunctional phosphoglucose/phosphomannose isomerase [Candidatus Nealsonbacteria bacterium RIFOXYB1_FULL_40_15]|uniref:Bifunctional phosphoglucose/phosphomannose isomerase n=2 Tax=Candidatus Nealsoniibacteriota TaxID=1817911 RepID=A0A1G2ER90_9BACT|nr:MAG: bifunctional phosphoglucose/phosphomannose isomerase [Candidatus Nealsonbacteria bacterium RIFOXYB1_FULL_40_15]OGZ27860.1 MAG: bifunctional phosphoglucose/phosphomannose isomerase [Candidatus Nealsonbacteria bacterium RIFOXYC1_FULL_40_7]OGZ28020.1 MAG: bifunctional phosphoglucose/phosphomannose isomerase [Candidatus Nealsonbacteria bacterium RIFOXYD1_FULL_39_11]